MKNNQINNVLAIFVLCAAALACSLYSEGKPAAEAGVVQFHAQLDAGNFTEIYAASHQKFKDATSEEEMVKLFTAVHTKLGAVKESTPQSWKAGNFNLVSTVTLVQDTVFENGRGTEQFTFVIEDKKAFLAGYYINSNDLIIK